MITNELSKIINDPKKVRYRKESEAVDNAIINTPSIIDKLTNGLVNIWEIVIARAFMYAIGLKKTYPDVIINNDIRLCVMDKNKQMVFNTRINNGEHKKVMIDKAKCEIKALNYANEITIYLKINEDSDYISNKFKQAV